MLNIFRYQSWHLNLGGLSGTFYFLLCIVRSIFESLKKYFSVTCLFLWRNWPRAITIGQKGSEGCKEGAWCARQGRSVEMGAKGRRRRVQERSSVVDGSWNARPRGRRKRKTVTVAHDAGIDVYTWRAQIIDKDRCSEYAITVRPCDKTDVTDNAEIRIR